MTYFSNILCLKKRHVFPTLGFLLTVFMTSQITRFLNPRVDLQPIWTVESKVRLANRGILETTSMITDANVTQAINIGEHVDNHVTSHVKQSSDDVRGIYHVTNHVTSHVKQSTNDVRGIYYLKLHKTGSTTMRSIIQRKALKDGATLPLFDYQDIGGNPDFNRHLVAIDSLVKYIHDHPEFNRTDKPGIEFEISWKNLKRQFVASELAVKENQCTLIENHTKFNRTSVERLIKEAQLFLATIRDPVSHIKSVANYFGLYKKWNINATDRFTAFLQEPEKYDKQQVTKNFMSKKFGWNGKTSNLEGEFLKNINSTFDVVLNERFDESLLVLKNNYNWDYEDMLYMKFYQFKYAEKNKKVDEEIREKVYRWSDLDSKLYHMFLDRQLALERAYGDTLQEELAVFRALNKQVNSFCFKLCEQIFPAKKRGLRLGQVLDKHRDNTLTIPASKFSKKFVVHSVDCVLMMLHEKMFNWLLQVRQRPQLCATGVLDALTKLKTFEPAKLVDMSMSDVKLFCNRTGNFKYGIPRNFTLRYFAGCYGQK